MSRPQLMVAGQARAGLRVRQEADGTPEQVHLTWDGDTARSVVVSWTSPGQAARPRVRIGQRLVSPAERRVADPLTGIVTWAYHARVDGLRPGATYGYAVTADNAADPFSATFTTAAEGRVPFRFSSFGDLAVPGAVAARPAVASPVPARSGQAALAAGAVETFEPLFHLLNACLPGTGVPSTGLPCTVPSSTGLATKGLATKGPVAGPCDLALWPQAWRDFGNDVQESAAQRPWLPAPDGRWYAFRVGAAAFVCLSGDGAACPGGQGHPAGRRYPEAAQTRWLESTLASARADASIDWIVVQSHPCALPCAADNGGPGRGAHREWLALFDAYEVDLVLSGHAHQAPSPAHGSTVWAGTAAAASAAAVAPRPHPAPTVNGSVFDSSQGTIHLALGHGAAHGIAVFDVDPGHEAGGQTSITARYYRPGGADPADPGGDYAHVETFSLIRPRSDGRRWHPRT